MRSFILFQFFCISIAHASLQCFNVLPSHAVSNTDSIAELFHVTAGECLNYCISESAKKGDGCASVVFHKKFNTCQLYGHDGSYGGAEVVYLEDHEFYIRSSWEGPCKDKTAPQRGYEKNPKDHSKPAIVPQFGDSRTQLLKNIPEFTDKQFPHKPDLKAIRDSVRKAPSNFENQFLNELESQKLAEDDLFNEHFTTSKLPRIQNNNRAIVTSFRNPTHNYNCSRNEQLSYFLVYGARLFSKEIPQRLNGVDQSSCVMYCSQNINAIGQNIPCWSLNYEPSNEVCEMYGQQEREKITWASLAIEQNYVFADKFCVRAKNDCPTETLYPVYLYKQMARKIIRRIPGLNSKVACLAECIDERGCRAITYKTGMCILHSASPSTDSSILLEGTEKTMVIENGCHIESETDQKERQTINIREELASSWQEWSLCQFGSKGRKVRVRTRECDDCDSDLQFETC